MRIPPLLASD